MMSATLATEPVAPSPGPHAATWTGSPLVAAFRPLERQATTLDFERNDEIFAQDEPAQYCYLVLSGCVRTVTLIEDGRRQVGEFLLPGDLFGCDSLAEHDFSAEAVTQVVVRRYCRRALESLADSSRELARTLRELSANQLRAARERMIMLGRKTASERIAGFLVEMSERGAVDAHGRIELPMSRTDVADHLGLTIETVCRGLSELHRVGTIAVNRGTVAIRNRRALDSAGIKIVH